MKRTVLFRALLGAAIPMMAEDVPAGTQAAAESDVETVASLSTYVTRIYQQNE
ncbi:hypothetical protein KPB05_23095 [Burkholderia gladioli]|uniref:hypothetical protein n=1 Tax=Burkholderia gladioli TaxID=28095 RepID=UPI0028586630|nr:hypothetical protein [Burkholderia gladioli]MDR8090349.1 hypothetical protein [Burkholderia gladioli]